MDPKTLALSFEEKPKSHRRPYRQPLHFPVRRLITASLAPHPAEMSLRGVKGYTPRPHRSAPPFEADIGRSRILPPSRFLRRKLIGVYDQPLDSELGQGLDRLRGRKRC